MRSRGAAVAEGAAAAMGGTAAERVGQSQRQGGWRVVADGGADAADAGVRQPETEGTKLQAGPLTCALADHTLGVVLAKAMTHNPGERLSRETGNNESSPNYSLWLWVPDRRAL